MLQNEKTASQAEITAVSPVRNYGCAVFSERIGIVPCIAAQVGLHQSPILLAGIDIIPDLRLIRHRNKNYKIYSASP
jgi:hypothetical protein